MIRKKCLRLALLTITFIGIITLLNNLDKIGFNISLMELYRNNMVNPYTSLDNSIVENPLEKFVKQENIVDIEVNSEDNTAINHEDINEYEIKSNNETVELFDDAISSNTQLSINENQNSFNNIITSYTHKFKSLEDELQRNLFNLIESALIDYNSGEYSDTDLANKYIEAGTNLEVSTDNSFYTILSDFENELKLHSYDTNLVTEIEDYYILSKEQIKLDIINRSLELVKR